MSNSRITKQAFAMSLRNLMEETSFEKITIAQICGACGMTRKSFYYHFKDKYDLVAWIFDQEYDIILEKRTSTEEFVELLCEYFYKNREFYGSLLRIEGQNSFAEHLEEIMLPVIQNWLQNMFPQEEIHPFYIDYIADGFVSALKRWLTQREHLSAKEFILLLQSMIHIIAEGQARRTEALAGKQ